MIRVGDTCFNLDNSTKDGLDDEEDDGVNKLWLKVNMACNDADISSNSFFNNRYCLFDNNS